MNCIAISLIFQCILLPLLNTLHFRLPFTSKSRQEAHFPLIAADVGFFALFTVSDYAEKTRRWNKQMFCFVALCILYVLNLLLNGSENIKPFSVLCLHLLIHAL